jgi:hypothetical protein
MRLYYTVASQPEAVQNKPSISLGGYKSSSPLPNSVVGNIFSDISMYTVKNANTNKYIGLVLKNETTKDAVNIEICFIYPTGAASKFRVAAVDMALDAEGQYYMEHIIENSSKPLYANFAEADGETNKINIGDLAIGEVVGIWLERELLLDAIKTQQNEIYQKTLTDEYRYEEIELPKEDNIGFAITWEEVVPLLPTITLTTGTVTIMQGDPITINANITNGGSTPIIEWSKNGVVIPDESSSSLTYIPVDGDVITAKLTSSLPLTITNPVFSNSITITVLALVLDLAFQIDADTSNYTLSGSDFKKIIVKGVDGVPFTVDWGDSTPIINYTMSTSNVYLDHIYEDVGVYDVLIHFDEPCLSYLYIRGAEVIISIGDLPTVTSLFNYQSANSLSGNVDDFTGTFSNLQIMVSDTNIVYELNDKVTDYLSLWNIPNATITGDLANLATSLTGMGLSGLTNITNSGYSFSNCSYVSIQNCLLSSIQVDEILEDLSINAVSNGWVDLTLNNIPTSNGLSAKALLELRGWTVLIDS